MMKKLLTFFLTALLAFSVGWAAEVTDVLNQAFTGVTGSSYTEFSNKTGASGAVYAGMCAGSYNSIQLRSTNSNSGVVTTASGGKVKSITIDWNTNTANGRTLNVYGKNTAYTAATELYGDNSGTLLGSIVKGTSTTLTINGDYEYIGFRCTGSAMFINSVTIVWETSGGSTPVTVGAPVFSINGTTVTGDQTVDAGTVVTITAASGNYISYTTDGSDPSGSAATWSDGNTATITVNATTRIRAIAIDDDLNSSNEVDYTFTVNSGGGSGDFTLVTDVNSLTAGDEIIFVSSGSNGSAFAMGSQNTNNRAAVAVTVSNQKVADANDIETFTLEGATGAWYFKANKLNEGYIYAASSGSNHLKTEATADDNAKATITIDDNAATIKFQGTNTRNLLRYNSSSKIFSCYSSGQQPVYIYHRSGTPKVKTPTFSVAEGTYTSAQVVEISCATSGATIYYTTDGSTPTTSSTPYSGAITVDHDMTIKAIAVATGYDDSDVATATYTINLTPTLTVSTNSLTVGANGGSFNVTAANLTQALTVTPSTGFSVDPSTLATDATYPATVNVTYSGQALGATGTVTVGNSNDNLSQTVNVTYTYDGDMYIVGDVNNTSWNFENGVPMTRNQDGTYSAHVTAQANGWYNGVQYAWLYFTKQVGNEQTVVANAFGPVSNGNWGLTSDLYGVPCDLDVNGNLHTIYMNPGSYEIVVNPANNKFMITPDVAAPVITPATGTYHEAQTVEITCATPGAAIYYTTDGTTPTASSTLYTAPFEVSSTTTVTAIAVSNGLTSTPATSTITIKLPGDDDYTLVTSNNDIDCASDYVLVYTAGENDYAMSTSISGNTGYYYQTSDNFLHVGNIITLEEGNTVNVLTLEDAGDGKYYIKGDGYYIGTSGNNMARSTTLPTTDVNTYQWYISISDNLAVIQNVSSSRYLAYNTSSPRFTTYASITSGSAQQYAALYRHGSLIPSITVNPTSLELVIPAGGTSQSATATVTERNTTENTTVAITGEGASHFNATLENGTLTVTYNGTATAATPDVATVTLTNGTATADVTVTGYKVPMTVTINPANGTTFSANCMDNVTISSNVDGATIEYSFDGSTWQTYNGAFSTPEVSSIGGTVTVYARATYNGDVATTQAIYTRVDVSSTLFTKVTSLDQIVAGNQYIIVYENADAPQALNGVNGGGTGATVAWDTPGSVIDIDNTDAIAFTLGGDASSATLSYVSGTTTYYLEAGSAPSLDLTDEGPTAGYDWSIVGGEAGYYLQWTNSSNQTYTLRYNTGMSNADKFRIYPSGTGQIAYLYVQGNAVATPHISPDGGRYPGDQTVSITCATPGATIYYTVNGGEQQTYSAPFTVELNENLTTATVVAWAVKDGETSNQTTVTYTYSIEGWVNNIAEFLALDEDEEVQFKNPVIVLFDYSQNNGAQDYIWVKDRSGYMKLFIQPGFDRSESKPRYDNGDVIPEGFKVKKHFYTDTQGSANFYEGLSTDPSTSNFKIPTEKALADPEQVKLSTLISNPATYNDRYLYISKVRITEGEDSHHNFKLAADENGTIVADDNVVVGYNKFPTWKEKDGTQHTVTIPNASTTNYYNVTCIFQIYGDVYEIMPIEFTPWEDNSIRLEDLVEVTTTGGTYTISNPLQAVKVTWDDNHGKFAIFAKDDEMYKAKRKPLDGQETYLIRYQNGDFTNTVEQADYDQSNWIEILIPSEVTNKLSGEYESTLSELQAQFENKILPGGSIEGAYVDALNPTIDYSLTKLPSDLATSEYTPNIYTPANFLMENIDTDGAKSYRDDELGNQYFFMMDGKPQEMGLVVWCYYPGNGDYFYIPARVGDQVNGHQFHGSFKADMSLCEDPNVSTANGGGAIVNCFDPSNADGNGIDQVKLYGFNAIVRKNPAYNSGSSNGAPRRVDVAPYYEGTETNPAYIVYPLNAGAKSTGTVTSVAELASSRVVESVRYYNIMGMESEQPFEGINIVVTRYSDGSSSTAKVLR